VGGWVGAAASGGGERVAGAGRGEGGGGWAGSEMGVSLGRVLPSQSHLPAFSQISPPILNQKKPMFLFLT